ncbi:MAG: YlxR family protein [Actinomycetota bacterium]
MPERLCLGCRRSASKADLIRIVAVKGAARLDPSGRAPGRGAYVHADPECVREACKGRRLASALRVSLGQAEAARLRREIEGIEHA